MSMTDTPQAGTDLTRTTINLTRRSMAALDTAADRDGLSKTDTINRALQVYDYLTRLQAEETHIVLRAPDGTLERLRIL